MELRRVFANSLFQGIARFITASVSLLVAISVARFYGVYEYGVFTKVVTIVGFLYVLVDFGFNAIFLAENSFKDRFPAFLTLRVFTSLFLVAILIGTFSIPQARFFLGLKEPSLVYLIIFSFTIVTYAITLSSAAIFQKNLQYKLLALATIAGSGVTLAGVFLSTFFSLPPYAMYISLLGGGMFAAFLSLKLAKQNFFPFSFDKTWIKPLLFQSAPLGLMLLFNLIYFRADIIILSVFRTTQEVGIYGMAYRIFEFLIAVPLFLSNSIYPLLLVHRKNYGTLMRLAKKYAVVYLIISIALVLISWFFAPLLIFVQKEFNHSIIPFRILLLSLPLFFITSLFQWILVAQKKQKFLLVLYVCLGGLNVALNVLFIPRYGILSASIITGVSELLVLLGMIPMIISLKSHYET